MTNPQTPKLNSMRVVLVVLFALILVVVEGVTGFIIYESALSLGYDGVYARYRQNVTTFAAELSEVLASTESQQGDIYGVLAGQTLTINGQSYTVSETVRQNLLGQTPYYATLAEMTGSSGAGDTLYRAYATEGTGSAQVTLRDVKAVGLALSLQNFDGILLASGSGRILCSVSDESPLFYGYLGNYGLSVDAEKVVIVQAGAASYAVSVCAVKDANCYAAGYINFTADNQAVSELGTKIITMVLVTCALTAVLLTAGIILAGSSGLFRRVSYRFVTNADGKILHADRTFKAEFPHVGEIKEQLARFNEYGSYAIKVPSLDGEQTLTCDIKKRGNGTILVYARKLEVPYGSKVDTVSSQTMEDMYEALVKKSRYVLLGEIYIGNLHNIKTMFGRDFSNKVREWIIKRLRDKFFIVCEIDYYTIGVLYADQAHIKHIIADLPEVMTEVNRPVQIGDDLVTVGVKGGFTFADRPLQAKHYSYIITAVGAALKRAQTDKEHDYFMYDDSQQKIYSKYFFRIDIPQMLRNGDFEMEYQPQYDLHEKRITGFEALFRVKKRAEINAGAFEIITYAERTGNMVLLGDFIFDTSMRFAKSVEGMGVTVSLNVSPVQLMQTGFVERFLAIFKKYDLPSGLICVEVTESFLMTTFEETVQKLDILRSHGIAVHLDDFGTDYSSLLYLKKLPIDTIKVDKEFVNDIATNEYSRSITRMVINLAHELNLSTICEGIEFDDQLAIVKELGGDIIQGFIVGRSQQEEVARKMITTFRLPCDREEIPPIGDESKAQAQTILAAQITKTQPTDTKVTETKAATAKPKKK